MRWILIGTIAASSIVAPCHANGFSLNDCILNGVKGVSSDVAARLVRKACEDKQEEHRQQRGNALKQEYGELIDTASVVKAKFFNTESAGFASIEITNSARSPERTLTYVKLSVMPAAGDNQPCDPQREARYSYKLTLKPGTSINLVFPSDAKAICTSIEAARGRPTAWKDFSLSGSVKPLDKDPFADPALASTVYYEAPKVKF